MKLPGLAFPLLLVAVRASEVEEYAYATTSLAPTPQPGKETQAQFENSLPAAKFVSAGEAPAKPAASPAVPRIALPNVSVRGVKVAALAAQSGSASTVAPDPAVSSAATAATPGKAAPAPASTQQPAAAAPVPARVPQGSVVATGQNGTSSPAEVVAPVPLVGSGQVSEPRGKTTTDHSPTWPSATAAVTVTAAITPSQAPAAQSVGVSVQPLETVSHPKPLLAKAQGQPGQPSSVSGPPAATTAAPAAQPGDHVSAAQQTVDDAAVTAATPAVVQTASLKPAEAAKTPAVPEGAVREAPPEVVALASATPTAIQRSNSTDVPLAKTPPEEAPPSPDAIGVTARAASTALPTTAAAMPSAAHAGVAEAQLPNMEVQPPISAIPALGTTGTAATSAQVLRSETLEVSKRQGNRRLPAQVVSARGAQTLSFATPSLGNASLHLRGPEWQTWHVSRMWPRLGRLEKFIAGITFMSMLKALCMAGNILVQISPYHQVQRWEEERCTGDADAAPYVSIAFGGWQWCYYGLFAFCVTKRSGFLILVHSNCLGAVLGTYYSITFYRNCKHDHSLGGLYRYMSAVIMLVLFQLCSLSVLPIERALFLTGLISSFCSFIGAISILVSLPMVIRTRDSSSIPVPLVTANMISSLVWCICGWMLDDPLIAAPNIVGFLSCGICLFCKHLYPSGDEWSVQKRRDPIRDTPLSPSSISSRRTAQARIVKAISYQSCDTGGTF